MKKGIANDQVLEYIVDNMRKTIKLGPDGLKPIVSPCMDSGFLYFFYWDTYFANLALFATGDEEQIQNNLDNMKWFVENFGFIPNAYQSKTAEDNETNRSQPPLFARGVWDYYCEKQDVEILKTYLPAMVKEYEFWQTNRSTPCGLNRYYHHANDEYLSNFYKWIMQRLGLNPALYEDKIGQGAHFLAIAESGWDFTCRYPEGDNAYACAHYLPVDLNSILYDVERIISQAYTLLGDTKKGEEYNQYAKIRKENINKYLLAGDGMYYDYNFVTEEHSPYVSGASLCPFAFGVSNDVDALDKTVALLEEEHGISVCEKKDRDRFDQWDFPSMWPPVVYFCVTALKRLNSDKFERIAKKYLTTVSNVYQQTGALWEKYNSQTGVVAVTHEYTTPKMMGWTAGVYTHIVKMLSKKEREDCQK